MSCERLFEVGARRDGRLAGAELASFERHISSCAECKAEAHALAQLAEKAREREPVDELAVRRTGLAILRRHDEEVTDPPRRRPWLFVLVPLAALVVLRVLTRTPAAPQVRAEPLAPPSATATVVASAAVTTPPIAETAPPPAPRAPDPTAEYRAAVAKLESGDDRAAAALFEHFAQRYPHHENAEDASYLRVVALQHTGDHAATTAAANEYLRAHPSGFRAKEVEKLRE